MDFQTVAGAIRFLLDHRQGKGWGRVPKSSASVTNTSEVVLALLLLTKNTAALTPREIPPPALLAELDAAVRDALTFIEDTLPTKKDPDIPNFAYALLAHLSGRDVPDSDFVELCLKGLNALWMDEGNPTGAPGHFRPSTFSTCLIMLALQEVQGNAALLASVLGTIDVVSTYDRAADYLFTAAPRDPAGGWKDADSDSEGHPAMAAILLYTRTRHLDLRNRLGLQGDPICAQAIQGLCNLDLANIDEYTYQMAKISYGLYYLPFVVLALSDHLDYLNDTGRTLYYQIGSLLAGPNLRLRTQEGTLAQWFPGTRQRDQNQTPIWATAHALRGLLTVPLSGRDLNSLNELMVHKANAVARIGTLESKLAGRGNQWTLHLGRRGVWIEVSAGAGLIVLTLASAILLSIYTFLWREWPKHGWERGLTVGAVALLAGGAVLIARHDAKGRWVESALAIVAFVGALATVLPR